MHWLIPAACPDGGSGFAGRLSTPLRTTLWLFREYMSGGRSGLRSFDRRCGPLWMAARCREIYLSGRQILRRESVPKPVRAGRAQVGFAKMAGLPATGLMPAFPTLALPLRG